jgi:hypothetical protein
LKVEVIHFWRISAFNDKLKFTAVRFNENLLGIAYIFLYKVEGTGGLVEEKRKYINLLLV